MVLEIRPVDLPDLRADAVRDITAFGPEVYTYAIEHMAQVGSEMLGGTAAQKADRLTKAEADRLREAELFYVSSTMTSLTVSAAKTLPTFSLLPEDLPAPTGLMIFSEPIGEAPDEIGMSPGMKAQIVGCCWGLMHLRVVGFAEERPFVWFTWYSDRDRFHELCLREGLLTEADIAKRTALYTGRLTLDNETLMACAQDLSVIPMEMYGFNGRRSPGSFDQDGTHQWAMVVKTAWLLMDQKIAQVEGHRYSRTDAKRIERRTGQTPPPTVRIVTLRQRERPDTSGELAREYHHQWVVRGHWRNQWHPGRGEHRPRWIAPHLKGPEDAPFLGSSGERVHSWTR